MGAADRVDDRTSRVNFSVDGVSKLRDRVNEKLKEFMGDYTDDTLVEYVIVLLRNGRSKEEARNELNVFLGDDDSDSFVSWLWDHLASNLSLYVQPTESYPDEGSKPKRTLGESAERDDSQHVDHESEREKSSRSSRNRHNQEWKTLVRDGGEPPPLRSSEIDNIRMEERTHHRREKQSAPTQPPVQKKRTRPNDSHETKRASASQATIDAPRRLLQFAVRDAVGTARPSIMASEPTVKRLRSVVSTPTGDSSLIDRPQRLKSVARVPNAVATAFKAATEAAEDVLKVRSSANVFDRLGRSTDEMDITHNQEIESREPAIEDGEYGNTKRIQELAHSNYIQQSSYRGQYARDMTMLESETGLASDSASDNEGYDDINVMGCGVMDASQTGTSHGNKGEDSLMSQYGVAKNAENMRKEWNKDQDQSGAVTNASRKIVNISVNVNTWKPPHYQASREVFEMDGRKPTHENVLKSDAQVRMENSNLVTAGNGQARPTADSQKVLHSAPVPYSAGHPSEDADSRTIFVSNVHFAATKDSLSRHFNKFGEVLKVVIITDAATGQPKGAAYVEFMQKEAAENALSLDGTSFMSRILKVVIRTAANPETTPVMSSWSRTVRGSPFASARFARAPFPRGIPGAFRARHPVKPGARSMQWKRDSQSTPSVPSPTARGLTYVRTVAKPAANSGTT